MQHIYPKKINQIFKPYYFKIGNNKLKNQIYTKLILKMEKNNILEIIQIYKHTNSKNKILY